MSRAVRDVAHKQVFYPTTSMQTINHLFTQTLQLYFPYITIHSSTLACTLGECQWPINLLPHASLKCKKKQETKENPHY